MQLTDDTRARWHAQLDNDLDTMAFSGARLASYLEPAHAWSDGVERGGGEAVFAADLLQRLRWLVDDAVRWLDQEGDPRCRDTQSRVRAVRDLEEVLDPGASLLRGRDARAMMDDEAAGATLLLRRQRAVRDALDAGARPPRPSASELHALADQVAREREWQTPESLRAWVERHLGRSWSPASPLILGDFRAETRVAWARLSVAQAGLGEPVAVLRRALVLAGVATVGPRTSGAALRVIAEAAAGLAGQHADALAGSLCTVVGSPRETLRVVHDLLSDRLKRADRYVDRERWANALEQVTVAMASLPVSEGLPALRAGRAVFRASATTERRVEGVLRFDAVANLEPLPFVLDDERRFVAGDAAVTGRGVMTLGALGPERSTSGEVRLRVRLTTADDTLAFETTLGLHESGGVRTWATRARRVLPLPGWTSLDLRSVQVEATLVAPGTTSPTETP